MEIKTYSALSNDILLIKMIIIFVLQVVKLKAHNTTYTAKEKFVYQQVVGLILINIIFAKIKLHYEYL